MGKWWNIENSFALCSSVVGKLLSIETPPAVAEVPVALRAASAALEHEEVDDAPRQAAAAAAAVRS